MASCVVSFTSKTDPLFTFFSKKFTASTSFGPALVALYPKLQRGGFCIVDDYFQFEECRQAIDEYREEHGIDDELVRIDNCSVYWRRK